MGILCDDPSNRALVNFGDIYDVSCKTISGGFCQASAAENLSKVLVLPDASYKSMIPLLRKCVLREALYYAGLWDVDTKDIRIEWKNTIFEPNKRFINIVFRGNLVAIYTIRDKYEYKYEPIQ